MKRELAFTVCVLATVMAILSVRPAPAAIDFTLNFMGGPEYPDFSEYPDFDSDCSGLQALFEEAARRYENILMDTHPLTINYWYEDLSGGTHGMHTGAVYDTTSPYRETECNIRIDTREDLGGAFRNWFIDQSPENDDEFDMQRILYRDLDPAAQAVAYNGATPDVFEAGYIGAATHPDAVDHMDMLSTIMHEIGHSLGVAWSGPANAETADGDYDVPPFLVGGATMAVNHAVNTNHLAGEFPMMRPAPIYSQRRLPCNADLFAFAQVQQYTYVRLEHREYLGGIDLNDSTNWIGGYTPTITVDGYVRPNNGVTPYAVTTSSIGFRNLSILEGSAVTISSGDSLYVIDEALIDGVDSTGMSRIRVQSGGTLNTGDLLIEGNVSGNSALLLFGGTANVNDRAVVSSNGSVSGYGILSVSNLFTNDGLLEADGGLLTLTTSSPNEVWNFRYGQVEAMDGNIDIIGNCRQNDGTITVGAGRRILINGQWTQELYGEAHLNGAAGNPAELALNNGQISGKVIADSEALISGPVLFLGGKGQMPDASDMLTLSGPATFRSCLFEGGGTLKQNGDITVDGTSGTTVQAAIYSWGNSVSGDSHDTLVDGTTFTINSSSTGTPGNEYRGVIELRNGTLAVNTTAAWTLPAPVPIPTLPDLPGGSLHMVNNGDASPPPYIEGRQLTVAGDLWASGGLGIIAAPLVTTPEALVSAISDAEIELRGMTTWNGGDIHGQGGIRQIADATVVGDTVIELAYYDWDGNDDTPAHTTINPGITLQINAGSIENGGNDGFDGVVNVNGGRLELNGVTSWSLTAAAHMNMDSSGSAAILAGAPVQVFGQVDVVGLTNEFQSEVTFESTANVTLAQANSKLNLTGLTTYRGGQYTGLGQISQSANATVIEATTIDVGIFDMDGSAESASIYLYAPLTLNVDKVDADNVFDGTIRAYDDDVTLSVNTSSRWVMNGLISYKGQPGETFHVAGDPMENSGDVKVYSDNEVIFDVDVTGSGTFTGTGKVTFNGSYNPGASPGLGSFEGDVGFGDDASLMIELGGTRERNFDRLFVAGQMHLDGDLVVSLINGFTPQIGDHFLIVDSHGLSGQFQGLAHGDTLGAFGSVHLQISYDSGNIELTAIPAVLPGDANRDGMVDAADAAILATNWQTLSGATWAMGDFNGDYAVNDIDATIMAANWQSGVDEQTVPEPSAVVGLLGLCLAGLTASMRRN